MLSASLNKTFPSFLNEYFRVATSVPVKSVNERNIPRDLPIEYFVRSWPNGERASDEKEEEHEKEKFVPVVLSF